MFIIYYQPAPILFLITCSLNQNVSLIIGRQYKQLPRIESNWRGKKKQLLVTVSDYLLYLKKIRGETMEENVIVIKQLCERRPTHRISRHVIV